MNKKTFFFVAVLGVMLSFSMPIFSMYDAILTRFENDITTKKLNIEKISNDLLEIYKGYIGIARKQSKNPSAFKDLEMSIMIEESGRQDEKAPEKHEELESQIPKRLSSEQEEDLKDLLDQEFAESFEEKYFKDTEANRKSLVEIFQTIKQYRNITEDSKAYSDFYNSIQLNFKLKFGSILLQNFIEYVGNKARYLKEN